MLRRLQAAKRLGGLVTALPHAAEPLDALRAVCGAWQWRAAAAQEALRNEGCSRSAVTRALGVPRGFCAAAGGGDKPTEPPVAAAAPPERESAAAQGDADGDAASSAASEARAPTRRKKAPRVGTLNEKTASGRPKPDVRTVARLVELGWWDTAEAAEAVLTRRKTKSRYTFETAGPAIDWLLNTLGGEKHSSGRCLAAHAVFSIPLILTYNASALQRGWELVTLSREAGGLGLSEEVARRRVATNPTILNYSRESVQKRAAFLETLGVPDGCAAIASQFRVLGFAEETLRCKAEWLRSQGLDVKRILSSHPSLLMLAAKSLLPKLDFMLNVVRLDVGNLIPVLLASSLDKKLRPRFFYAMQHAKQRYALSSLVCSSDATIVKMVHRLEKPATVNEIAAYKAHIASPAFRAYMDEQERIIRTRSATARDAEPALPSRADDVGGRSHTQAG